MTKLEKLDELLYGNGGVLKTSEVVAAGISKSYFMEYVKNAGLEKVSHGIYMSKESWKDGMYLLQARFAQIIFSHETALYLSNLAEREPLQYTVTVMAKYHSESLKEQNVKVYSVKKDLYDLGVCETVSPMGHVLRTYNMERTICDLIRSRRDIEMQDYQTALREYVKRRDKNVPRLMRYAKSFHVETILRQYMEVLL